MKYKTQNRTIYDLEERTFKFALDCREFVKLLPKSIPNFEYSKQLIRSSGSQAANYIEANESLGKKDFLMRIKICRKESKESILWLRLLDIDDKSLDRDRRTLVDEATQLMKIFSSILIKSE